MLRLFLAGAVAAAAALPVSADETEGLVLAFDRKAGVIVFTDKTVWLLPDEIALPEDLGRGDRLMVEYDSAGEDGLTEINALTRLAKALPAGTDGGS